MSSFQYSSTIASSSSRDFFLVLSHLAAGIALGRALAARAVCRPPCRPYSPAAASPSRGGNGTDEIGGVVPVAVRHSAWSESALKEVEIDHGSDAIRRGAATVTGVCMTCYSLKHLHYRDLLALGFSAAELEAMSMGNPPAAQLTSLTPADVGAQTYGRAPPDLSLMAKAREGGPRYIYSLLTGFYQDEKGATNNHLYPGIRMPAILGWGSADTAQRAARRSSSGWAFTCWGICWCSRCCCISSSNGFGRG